MIYLHFSISSAYTLIYTQAFNVLSSGRLFLRFTAAALMIQPTEVLRSSSVLLLNTVIQSLHLLKSPTTPTGYMSRHNTDI